MTFFRYVRTTPSIGIGGTWTGTITDDLPTTTRPDRYKLHPLFMRHLLVRSTLTDTEFDVTVTDYESIPIRVFTTATQVVNDLTLTPIMGETTVTISNVAVNADTFTVLVVLEENPGE
jgi:hypothetical protein